MLVKVDLHIHSALSPCCENENTLRNIVNMSGVLGTQIIAISDHNTAGNLRAAQTYAKKKGILVVPAMEVTTAEEIHVLCFFRGVSDAESFSGLLAKDMPKYPLNRKFYNSQLLLDEKDNVTGEVGYFLNVATRYGIYELIQAVKERSGVAVPAHVDRESNSVLSVLGAIPDDLGVAALEVSPVCPPGLKEELKQKYYIITGSDAHCLEKMCVNDYYVDLPEVSVAALLTKLNTRI